jgi:hypothetical protein
MRILGPFNSGVGAGGAGVATNNATTTTQVVGRIAGIYVRYNDSCPATTDVVIKTVGTSPAIPSQTILTLTDANTDGFFMPRITPQDMTGADLIALTVLEPITIADFVNVTMAQADDACSVDVWLLLE